jgi:hypothetical protein
MAVGKGMVAEQGMASRHGMAAGQGRLVQVMAVWHGIR